MRWLILLAILLAGCAAPTGPKLPPPPTVSPKYTLNAIEYPVVPSLENIKLTWNYATPMPDPDGQVVFELWHTHNLRLPFTRLAVVSAPPVTIPLTNIMDYFICRASNVLSGEVSSWNTKTGGP